MQWFEKRPERNHEKLIKTYCEKDSQPMSKLQQLWESGEGELFRRYSIYVLIYINTQQNTGEKDRG